MTHSKIKILIFIILVLVVIALNASFRRANFFTNPQDGLFALQQVVNENMFKAMLIYIAITIVGCVLLFLPGVFFAVAAGVLFGPVWGTIACSLATTMGACLAFISGRYFLKASIQSKVMNNALIRRFFFEEVRKNDIWLLMITRLVPIFPFNLQNFAYGITDIKFRPFAIYSLIFMLPGTAIYVMASAGMVDARNRFYLLSAAGILFALTTTLSLLLRRRTISKEKI